MSAAREWFNRTFPKCVDCGRRDHPFAGPFYYGTYREQIENVGPRLRCAKCHLIALKREAFDSIRREGLAALTQARRLAGVRPHLRLISGGKP